MVPGVVTLVVWVVVVGEVSGLDLVAGGTDAELSELQLQPLRYDL